jgi:hypothetical protein
MQLAKNVIDLGLSTNNLSLRFWQQDAGLRLDSPLTRHGANLRAESTDDFEWTWSRSGSPLRSANYGRKTKLNQSRIPRSAHSSHFAIYVERSPARDSISRGLPGNVHAEIPGLGVREESRVRKSMHLRSPLFLRGGRCLEPRPIAGAQRAHRPSPGVHVRPQGMISLPAANS